MKKKNLWFKAKNYGWGWVPVTWQGWSITLLFILIITKDFLKFDSNSHSASDTLINFVPRTFVSTILLFVICYLKGEKPEWRWRGKKIKF